MEFDLTVKALRENDQTTKVARPSDVDDRDEDDTEISLSSVPWLSDDEATAVRDERSAAMETYLSALDDESNTEVRAPALRSYALTRVSRAGPPLYPSVEAIIPATMAPSRPARPRARRGRAASLLSLGMLCFAFGAVLALGIQGRPVGTVRRLPASTTFHEPATAPVHTEPLPTQRPNAVQRGAALATEDAGLQPTRVQRQPKLRAKVSAHVKRAKR